MLLALQNYGLKTLNKKQLKKQLKQLVISLEIKITDKITGKSKNSRTPTKDKNSIFHLL